MFSSKHLLVLTGAILLSNPALADSVYVLNAAQQFGSLDVSTGVFNPIGPGIPEGTSGLAPTLDGSLLTLGFDGNLDRIDPMTGLTNLIGPTSLGDCSAAASPCGPNSANAIATLGGKIYATDFQNNLYSLDPSTGHATLIGPTGIPALPFVPLSQNSDGTVNVFDEGFFGVNGILYATFDTGTVDFSTGVVTPIDADNLYRIDPTTGATVVIGPTIFSQNGIFAQNGGIYSFANATSQILSLDLSNGNTSVFGNFDPAIGIIGGAATVSTPEPASFGLVAIVVVLFSVRKSIAMLRTRRS